jgi:hypothetical protein
VTPADPDRILASQFEDLGLGCEAAPKLSDVVTLTRRVFATLRVEPSTNADLIEAINQYSPREEPRGFVVNAGHTLERFFVRALEVFAAWQYAGGLDDDWGPAPNYALADKARI